MYKPTSYRAPHTHTDSHFGSILAHSSRLSSIILSFLLRCSLDEAPPLPLSQNSSFARTAAGDTSHQPQTWQGGSCSGGRVKYKGVYKQLPGIHVLISSIWLIVTVLVSEVTVRTCTWR